MKPAYTMYQTQEGMFTPKGEKPAALGEKSLYEKLELCVLWFILSNAVWFGVQVRAFRPKQSLRQADAVVLLLVL